MEELEFYRKTIEAILRKYTEIPYSYGEIEQYLIIDRDRNHFMLFDVGWQQKQRVHGAFKFSSYPQHNESPVQCVSPETNVNQP